jgi:exopolysaccharide biosynthesis polyprenyl glycosylphosphotransferase
MTLQNRKTLLEVGMCSDLAVCGFSLLLASAMVYRPLWEENALLLRRPLRQAVVAVVLVICWHLSLVAAGVYKTYRTISWTSLAGALIGGSVLSAVSTWVWLSLNGWGSQVPLRLLLLELPLFGTLTLSGLILTRIGSRVFMRFLHHRGCNPRNVLIIGSNRRAIALADNLLEDREFGYRLAGFVDDSWYFDGAPPHYKQMLVGRPAEITELLRDLALDEVIVALPISSCYQLTQRIVDLCRKQGITIRCEGNLFDVPHYALPITDAPLRLITLHDCARNEWCVASKRLVDILVSATALIAVFPLLAFIAVAIKVTSKGPIIFSQERLGIGKRIFRVFKFRTMVLDAESLMANIEHLNQSAGPHFKLRNDPRVTRIGAFLRKTSLDELPQLFNVFLGDMSLVGPRPIVMRDYRGISEEWHRRRFSVKPGITCLWQVNGRSSVTFDRWMELDMDYIDRWSLWLDLKILIQTIPAVMRGSGAM